MPGRDARAILRAMLAAVEQRLPVDLPPGAPADELIEIARKHRLSPLLSALEGSGLDAAVM